MESMALLFTKSGTQLAIATRAMSSWYGTSAILMHLQIHVRTWQPDYIDKEHGQKLNPNDVFSLGDFDL